MPIMFNTILAEADLSLADVRLPRHKDQRAAKGRTIYELWRDARQDFDLYQSIQKIGDRASLRAPYWASFVGTPNNETMFAGLYHVKYRGLLEQDTPAPHMDDVYKAGSHDVYDLTLAQALGDLVGKLLIDWGPGYRKWGQRTVVTASIKETCEIRGRRLHVTNVRTNHAHSVVSAACGPSRVLNALKSNATRALREDGSWLRPGSPWADRGSKRYLWTEVHVQEAIDYVELAQGDEFPGLDDVG